MKSGKVEIPTKCPSCKSTLVLVKDQLFCYNIDCSAVNKQKILNFIKVTKIKGLGEKTVEKLGLKSIEDIYNLDAEVVKGIIGDKLSTKIMQEIKDKEVLPVGTFLAAFSIPLVGKTTANKVQVTELEGLTYSLLKEFGIGDKAAMHLMYWIKNEYVFLNLPITLVGNSIEVIDSGYIVCVSGKIEGYTRSSIQTALEQLRVGTSTTVTKKTTHLICDTQKNSTKEKKALEYGIPILTFKTFKETLKND